MPNAFVLRNAYVTIGGVDLSDHIHDVTVQQSADEVDVTAMGAGGHQRLAGIRDDRFTMTAYSDFSAAKLHATVNPYFQSGGTFVVVVAASGSTISATNPFFIGTCVALTYSPVAGAVGDASMTPLEFPTASGTISTATS